MSPTFCNASGSTSFHNNGSIGGCPCLFARNQGVLIIALGLEFGSNLSQRGVHKVQRLQNAGTDRGIIVVFDGLLYNGDVLEVAAENCWRSSDFRSFKGDGSVYWGNSIDPVELGIHMKLVRCDCCINGGGCGSLLGKVALRKSCSPGSPNEVICRMFIGICCLETRCSDYFEDGVHA